MWHKHDRRKMLAEAEAKFEHQSVMGEVSSQPIETIQHQSLLQKSPMKQRLVIQSKCILCGAQAEAEERVDHGTYNITQRKEMVEAGLLCSKIRKTT
jgi:hypothetical protein